MDLRPAKADNNWDLIAAGPIEGQLRVPFDKEILLKFGFLIKSNLTKMKGIQKVEIDNTTHSLVISYDPVLLKTNSIIIEISRIIQLQPSENKLQVLKKKKKFNNRKMSRIITNAGLSTSLAISVWSIMNRKRRLHRDASIAFLVYASKHLVMYSHSFYRTFFHK